MMSKSKLLLVFVWAFLAAILLGSFVFVGDWLKVLAILVFFLIGLRRFSFNKLTSRDPLDQLVRARTLSSLVKPDCSLAARSRCALAFMLLGCLLGLFRFFWVINAGDGKVEKYLGRAVLRGCITEEVDVRSDKVKYVLTLEDDYVKILLNADRYPVYEYGDCLFVEGKLEKPRNFNGFDYSNYLARYGIQGVMSKAKVTRITEKSVDGGILKFLYFFKGRVEAGLNNVFSEPNSSLVAGLLLGSRRGVSDDLMKDFNITGLSHILAVSGYNITLVVGVVNGFLGFFTRKKRVVVAVIFIFVFVLLVGASAAVVRAGIMGFIALLALWFGRQYLAVFGLWLAVFLMILWNPLMMLYDLGFQLSFLATAGLIYISPLLERRFFWLPQGFFRESVLMTVSAQVLALPVILVNFGSMSLITILANLLVSPLVPIAMLLGFLAVVANSFGAFWGIFVGFFADMILNLLTFIVENLAEVPFASLEIGWFSWWMGLGYYFCVLRWLSPKS